MKEPDPSLESAFQPSFENPESSLCRYQPPPERHLCPLAPCPAPAALPVAHFPYDDVPRVPALSNLLSLFSWAGFSVLGRRDFPDALRLFLEEASAQEPENTQSEAGSLSPEIHALHLEFPTEHGTRGSPHRTIQKPGLHRVSQTPRKMPSTGQWARL